MKKIVLVMTSALALASCGKQESREAREDLQTFDVQEEATSADSVPPPPAVRVPSEAAGRFSPNVGVTAAPGVAFNYRYAFRVPNTAISKVQEQHAQLCEKLGLDRCRITGMRYRLIDEDNVSAMLALKLDPTLARQFGKDSIAQVSAAEGMLVDSEISGTDVGTSINAATRQIANIRDEIRQLELRLRDARNASDRDSIRQQIAQLQSQIRARQDTRSDEQESLATTPMVFNYGSGTVVPGFDDRSPVGDAFRQAWSAFQNILAGIIIVAGALLPILAIVLLLWWLLRRFKPAGWANKSTPAAAANE